MISMLHWHGDNETLRNGMSRICDLVGPQRQRPGVQADSERLLSCGRSVMNYEIPLPLKQEHEALHDQSRQRLGQTAPTQRWE